MSVNLNLVVRLVLAGLGASIAATLPAAVAFAQSTAPSPAALAIVAAVKAAQDKATADGLPEDEAAAAIAVAAEGALPAGLTSAEVAALLDEVTRLLGTAITPAMSIALSVVREDHSVDTPPPGSPGAGPAAGRPVIPAAGTPPPGSAGDDSESDPGYQAPQ